MKVVFQNGGEYNMRFEKPDNVFPGKNFETIFQNTNIEIDAHFDVNGSTRLIHKGELVNFRTQEGDRLYAFVENVAYGEDEVTIQLDRTSMVITHSDGSVLMWNETTQQMEPNFELLWQLAQELDSMFFNTTRGARSWIKAVRMIREVL